MTIEQLQSVHKAQPFRPFTLHLAEGRELHVPHREFLSHSPSGRTVIVFEPDESFSIVDLLLVTRIQIQQNGAAGKSRKKGNGRDRSK
ncbi:MAG: hypothetical protein KY475_26230 [Planctomycetes bacterium]|nr:hypothetical protein [Planctomycetota bacterium]